MPLHVILLGGQPWEKGAGCNPCRRRRLLCHDLWLLPYLFPPPKDALSMGSRCCPSPLLPQETPGAAVASKCFFFLCKGHFSALKREVGFLQQPHNLPRCCSLQGAKVRKETLRAQNPLRGLSHHICPLQHQKAEAVPSRWCTTAWTADSFSTHFMLNRSFC